MSAQIKIIRHLYTGNGTESAWYWNSPQYAYKMKEEFQAKIHNAQYYEREAFRLVALADSLGEDHFRYKSIMANAEMMHRFGQRAHWSAYHGFRFSDFFK